MQKTISSRKTWPFLPAFLIAFITFLSSCEDEKEFIFDLEDLYETQWGIPQIIEPGQGNINLDAPTVFYADGHVTIGNAYTDFWSTRGTRSLFLEQTGEVWFIIDLSPERLYVEKTSYPDGTFLVKCLYEPMKK